MTWLPAKTRRPMMTTALRRLRRELRRVSTPSAIASSTAVIASCEPCRLDDEVVAALEALVPLAPLHQPIALAGIRALQRLMPDVPAVACFDTAFHASITPAAADVPVAAANGASGSACAGSASTACRTRTRRAAPWSWPVIRSTGS